MNRFYSFALPLLNVVFRLFFPLKIIGRENIPDSAALVCANHSSYADPVLLVLAFTSKHPLHFMAKEELFQKPFLRWLLPKIESFPVRRGAADLSAIKQAMKYLKSGEKVMMFPEGKRVRGEVSAAAKSGAAMLAVRTKAPLLPVGLPAKRRLFQRNTIVIGKPYHPELDGEKPSSEAYRIIADDLLLRMNALRGEAK
jgi:1-acyl-sn-glycerol-3-phosphate acyltransferase